MEIKLVKYDAACKAIAAARSVDEVKKIRDVSVAMKAYARQAHNHDLEADAIEIRMRATRRMDQMRQEQKAGIGLAKGTRGQGRPKKGGPKKIPPKTVPTLAEAGIDKNLAHEGRKLGALTDKQFEGAIKTAREAITSVVRTAVRGSGKKRSRATREKELAVEQRSLTGTKQRYGVIYADPPWKFEPYSRDTGLDRAADNHYPTMELDDIKALPIPAAKNAVLFLWATVPMLPQALDVLAAWGFEYKSHCVWLKPKPGTGYWFRNTHELLLVGTCGNKLPAPEPGKQWESAIEGAVGKHSEKPKEFRDMIEELFPNLPKIELFARGDKPKGWDVWGNEAAAEADKEAA